MPLTSDHQQAIEKILLCTASSFVQVQLERIALAESFEDTNVLYVEEDEGKKTLRFMVMETYSEIRDGIRHYLRHVTGDDRFDEAEEIDSAIQTFIDFSNDHLSNTDWTLEKHTDAQDSHRFRFSKGEVVSA